MAPNIADQYFIRSGSKMLALGFGRTVFPRGCATVYIGKRYKIFIGGTQCISMWPENLSRVGEMEILAATSAGVGEVRYRT